MSYSFLDFVSLLGALGFFIFGMKIMSEGIQKVAGSRMRQILEVMTSNRFAGVLTGFLLTGLVQSSSATTVMVVSFVNAGMLSLIESIGVIMGANIGTTVTAWIISTVGFKISISNFAFPIIAIGAPLLFMSYRGLKAWGEVLLGFAVLFMGLEAMKEFVPDLHNNPEILAFLQSYTNLGYLSIVLFVLIGTILTLVVQSSSAAMAITIVMANQGWIPFELAAAIVLGENIGTTVTANLAALVANVHAKRAARAHFIFNVMGVAWMLILFFPFLKAINFVMIEFNNSSSPFTNAAAIPVGLSLFHTSFNIINTLLLLPFTNKIAVLVTQMVPSKGQDDIFKLEYIGVNIMKTPELSILEARKEIAKFGQVTLRMSDFNQGLLTKENASVRKKLLDKIKHYEEITDRIELEVSDFMSKVAEGNLSDNTSEKVRTIISINGDLERVGDIFYRVSLAIERKYNSSQWFDKHQIANLLEMFALLDKALEVMLRNLDKDYDKVQISEALTLERQINAKRNELKRKHLKSIEKGEYEIQTTLIYNELVEDCEKIGDHIFNITETITGEGK